MNRLSRCAVGLSMILACGVVSTSIALAEPAPTTAPSTAPAAVAARITETVAPSLVRVEYTLQFDKGEAPQTGGWRQRCPSCGNYHTSDAEETVKDERPVETGGFLIGNDRVLTADPVTHPRFIKSIAVRIGNETVPAHVVAHAVHQNAIVLQLTEPVEGAKPLAFDPSAKGPYHTVAYQQENAQWQIHIQPLPQNVTSTSTGRRFVSVPSNCIIVSASGAPVAASMTDELPDNDSWKAAPSNWELIDSAQMTDVLNKLEQHSNAGLLRVTLNFRSPRQKAGEGGYSRMYRGRNGDDESKTEQQMLGVLVNDSTVLVLAELKPDVTSRLTQIRVHSVDGKTTPATFAGTLTDYGALIAKLQSPMQGAVKLGGENIIDYRTRLLPAAEIQVQGEKRVAYFAHRRIASCEVGWRRQILPDVPGETDGLFLFDTDGNLLALPISRRLKPGVADRWASENESKLTPAAYLNAVLGNLPKSIDSSNIPLSEEEENRIAWMGVELQKLDQELARANGVSDLTRDGETGAIVTKVYPNSPAAAAGVEAGYVLLRLHVADQPKPIEIEMEDGHFDRQFPWEQLDQVPEQYFDQIPQPFPSAENSLATTLTQLGFGKSYQAEFFHNGQRLTKQLTVTQSPPHYGSAPRHKSDRLGLTARDMTFESRPYFRKQEKDPGVIISKIEPGSKASVAGIKPYEIITHVNDSPVHDVKELEQLLVDKTDVRLTIQRMMRSRQVKVTLPATTQPTTKPAAGS